MIKHKIVKIDPHENKITVRFHDLAGLDAGAILKLRQRANEDETLLGMIDGLNDFEVDIRMYIKNGVMNHFKTKEVLLSRIEEEDVKATALYDDILTRLPDAN